MKKKRPHRRKHEFELACLMQDALNKEDFELCAALKEEVAIRQAEGKLDKDLVEMVRASKLYPSMNYVFDLA
jgi:hypothetical protein